MPKHYPRIPNPVAKPDKTSRDFTHVLNTELALIVDQLGVIGEDVVVGATILQLPHAQRPGASTVDLGTLLWESDRNILYLCKNVGGAHQWGYLSGDQRGTISPDQKPADLGTNDAGYLFTSTDFNRVYRWSGSAWADAPGQDARDYIAFFRTAPGTGWAVCDGTAAVNISTATGGVAAITVPDLNDNTYVKGAGAYSGPTSTAPVAPTLSGSTAATTATNNAAATGVTVDSASTGASVSTGTGSFDGGASSALTSASLTDPGHTHNITDPTHNHTQNSHTHAVGTLAVSSTGEPRVMAFLPYLRL